MIPSKQSNIDWISLLQTPVSYHNVTAEFKLVSKTKGCNVNVFTVYYKTLRRVIFISGPLIFFQIAYIFQTVL